MLLSQKTISDIASRLNDSEFKDFGISDYYDEFKKANRQLARKYQIFTKVYSFNVSDLTDDLSSDIILDIPDFRTENAVYVNGYQLHKVSSDIKALFEYVYYLEFIDEEYHFNYVLSKGLLLDEPGYDITENMSKAMEEKTREMFNKKNKDDQVVIIYDALPDGDDFLRSYYEIPQTYYDELVGLGLYYMAERGMIKYANTEKFNKYKTVYQLYQQTAKEKDKYPSKNKEFILIQPFSII